MVLTKLNRPLKARISFYIIALGHEAILILCLVYFLWSLKLKTTRARKHTILTERRCTVSAFAALKFYTNQSNPIPLTLRRYGAGRKKTMLVSRDRVSKRLPCIHGMCCRPFGSCCVDILEATWVHCRANQTGLGERGFSSNTGIAWQELPCTKKTVSVAEKIS